MKRENDRLDKVVLARAKDDPAWRLLMTVPGVGSVTARAYAATVGDPERFAKSRAVGAYVGLTSRRWQSGERDYSGRISKHGDAMMRALLYEAANSLLTVVRRARPRPRCDRPPSAGDTRFRRSFGGAEEAEGRFRRRKR